jgi:DNA-binding LacI/PurR family transcriptional regulator
VGVPFDEDLVAPGLYTYRSGLDAAERGEWWSARARSSSTGWCRRTRRPSGRSARPTPGDARYEGFRAALEAVGVPFDEDLVAPGLYTYRSGLDGSGQIVVDRVVSSNPQTVRSLGTSNPRRCATATVALEAVGVPFDEDLVAPGLYTYRSGLDAAERLLDLADCRR